MSLPPSLLTNGTLDSVLAPFGKSRMPPAEFYTSPEIFAWELERFYFSNWVVALRSADLPSTGDQKAISICGRSLLAIRGDTSTHLFQNICRHRGHELVPCGESVTRQTIQCPYHSWTYRLDGSLKSAPDFGGDAERMTSDFSLLPVRSTEWHGWVFVNISGDAPPIGEQLGGLEEHIASYEPERLNRVALFSDSVDANWKVILENFQECYHCSGVHPQLCRIHQPYTTVNLPRPRGGWVGGPAELNDGAETASLDGKSRGVPMRRLDASAQRRLFYAALFPNLMITFLPDYIETCRVEPISPTVSRIDTEFLFPPEVVARPGFDPSYAVNFWRMTDGQDVAVCEGVQRGISGGGYVPGPLSWSEDGLYQFVTMVARGYLGLPMWPAPVATERVAS